MKIEEIIICDQCKGVGLVEYSELENYHHREYRYWNEDCGVCGGKGRMKQTTKITLTKLEDK